jgi:hypothetical protein
MENMLLQFVFPEKSKVGFIKEVITPDIKRKRKACTRKYWMIM